MSQDLKQKNRRTIIQALKNIDMVGRLQKQTLCHTTNIFNKILSHKICSV
ncbi:MAG: hypothetical protein K2Y32_24325 [Candidatus Obscuribacterales bacterium]|nr:hypothetical protein [Candidatus Obscuribacterales bacterium]